MAIKVYSAFPKASPFFELTISLFTVLSMTLVGESYPSSEMGSVYSAAQTEWAWKIQVSLKMNDFKASLLKKWFITVDLKNTQENTQTSVVIRPGKFTWILAFVFFFHISYNINKVGSRILNIFCDFQKICKLNSYSKLSST